LIDFYEEEKVQLKSTNNEITQEVQKMKGYLKDILGPDFDLD